MAVTINITGATRSNNLVRCTSGLQKSTSGLQKST